MKKCMVLFAVLSTLTLTLFCGLTTAYASNTQQNVQDICADAKNNSNGTIPSFCSDFEASDPQNNPVADTIVKVASAIAFITGIVAVIMIMYASFELITGGSDSQRITRARQIIFYAVIGIAVIMFARLLVSFAITVFVK